MKILLVDDQRMFRQALSVLLQHAEVEEGKKNTVIEAATAADGLGILRSDPAIDLVLLDFFLSDERAPEAIRQFVSGSRRAPVVVMSSADNRADAAMALQCGASGYISKSVSLPSLKQLVAFAHAGELRFVFTLFGNEGLADATAPQRPQAPRTRLGTVDEALGGVTPRQREILRLVACGKTNKEIGRTLGMEEATVKSHLRLILRRSGFKNRTQLAVYGVGPAQQAEAAPQAGAQARPEYPSGQEPPGIPPVWRVPSI
jgi:two-component system nitrate/nitrite response regulator NarL